MEDLTAARCVQTGTTTELNITDATSEGLSIELKVFPDADSTWAAFVEGACDGFTTDKSGIASYVAAAADPSLFYIMEETLSKEPLGPLWSQSDPQFGDIITWTVYGLIQAEEWGMTSQNIDEFVASDDPGVQRLLGQADNAAGSLLGIPNDFMINVIRQVGNYGEIYARNLGVAPFNMARGLNALWTDGGLQYAPPFR
jgi:general L-amino acid transport system substrate-binding protein